jgi:hypothetical protein
MGQDRRNVRLPVHDIHKQSVWLTLSVLLVAVLVLAWPGQQPPTMP